MTRGTKVFSPANVPENNTSDYPDPFRAAQRKRHYRYLGDFAGLKNFGINLVRVAPGGQSSARHAHSKLDEFIYVLEGELLLVTNAGRVVVGPGTGVGFPVGTGDAHHFLNESLRDASFLVVGDRTAGDACFYPDIDLAWTPGPDGKMVPCRKDGTLYPPQPRD